MDGYTAHTADVLERAADRIEEVGWYNPKLTGVAAIGDCVLTAIGRVEGWQLTYPPSEALRSFLGMTDNASLALWNDSFDTPEPVTTAMRECAAKIRANLP